MLDGPDEYVMHEKPGLVVLDIRSQKEGQEKFDHAIVQQAGTIILTCPEELAARRKLGLNVSEEEVQSEVKSLRIRNRLDRVRDLGRMTLPKDMRKLYYADKILRSSEPRIKLIEAGAAIAQDPESALVMRTDRLTIEEEFGVLELFLNGILMVAYDKSKPI